MFWKRRHASLRPPPISNDPAAFEMLRVWAHERGGQQVVLKTTWQDPAGWGLLLVDLAGHAAKAYAGEGWSEADAFARILDGLKAELAAPTDRPQQH